MREVFEWILSLEMTETQGLIFLVAVRFAWAIVSTWAVYRSLGEYRKNRLAYFRGLELRNGKKIVRKGRFTRSRRVLWAFLIASSIGYMALIQSFFVTPKVQTSIFTALITIALIWMLVLFERSTEADRNMRAEAKAYAEKSGDDPKSIHQNIGEEVVGGPDDSVKEVDKDK